MPFLAVTLLNETYMRSKQENGQRVLETTSKNKKDGGPNVEKFGFQRRFLEIFCALANKTVFITFLGLKDWWF